MIRPRRGDGTSAGSASGSAGTARALRVAGVLVILLFLVFAYRPSATPAARPDVPPARVPRGGRVRRPGGPGRTRAGAPGQLARLGRLGLVGPHTAQAEPRHLGEPGRRAGRGRPRHRRSSSRRLVASAIPTIAWASTRRWSGGASISIRSAMRSAIRSIARFGDDRELGVVAHRRAEQQPERGPVLGHEPEVRGEALPRRARDRWRRRSVASTSWATSWASTSSSSSRYSARFDGKCW